MSRSLTLVVVAAAASSWASPPVQIDCPGGTEFIAGRGCVAKVADSTCPKGTRFDGAKCIALVDTSCPAGHHFIAGTGCVADAAGSPAPAPAAAEPASGKKKKGGTYQSGFLGDRLSATCGGATFEVYGTGRLTGVHALMLADGTRLGEEVDVDVGQSRVITGKHLDKAVELKVQQGVFGTRYVLKVAGAECKLSK